MSSRVQKGGTLFRPVVKSRARASNSVSRQPSAAAGAESTQELSLGEGSSTLTTTQSNPEEEPVVSQRPDAESANRSIAAPEESYSVPPQPTLPPAVGSSLIGIPIGSVRRSTPIIVQARNTANQRHSNPINSNKSSGSDYAHPVDLTVNASDLNVGPTQVDISRTIPLGLNNSPQSQSNTDSPTRSTAAFTDSNSMATVTGETNTPNNVSKGKVSRRKSLDDNSAKKRKRRKGEENQEGENLENADGASVTKLSRSRASSNTPKPRKRAPSPPPYDPDADPGEEIDPTTVTMASLCSDTGQGRVSKKAAEILSNHAAWKIKNREKRARMKLLMEAKKYGREEEEAEPNAEPAAPENSTASGSAESPTAATAVPDNTGNGFDYSQDLTTSRFNVQVRIGPNGETVIDENSLVVDRAEDDGTENYTHIVESDHTKFVNSGTYGKRYRGSRWSAEETELFYDALAQYGENYELIAYVLPGRDRKSCKNKFKVEDKRNHARINYCLDNSIPVDMKTLSRMTGKDFTGPVPEIRAPTPLPQIPIPENEAAESAQSTETQNVIKKRSRSKSHNLDDGVVVIGEAETLS